MFSLHITETTESALPSPGRGPWPATAGMVGNSLKAFGSGVSIRLEGLMEHGLQIEGALVLRLGRLVFLTSGELNELAMGSNGHEAENDNTARLPQEPKPTVMEMGAALVNLLPERCRIPHSTATKLSGGEQSQPWHNYLAESREGYQESWRQHAPVQAEPFAPTATLLGRKPLQRP
jgi:hypothetical protein